MKVFQLLALAAACAPGVLPAQDGRPTVSTIFRFKGTDNGYHPQTQLLVDQNGALYGTDTTNIFRLTPPAVAGGTWTKKTVYDLPRLWNNTKEPDDVLLMGANGIIYGTSSRGGSSASVLCSNVKPVGVGCGTVFALQPPASPRGAWTRTTLYSFNGAPDGAEPYASLIMGSGGVLYGTTYSGGTSLLCTGGCGTVFMLAPPSAPGGAWTESVLYSFSGTSDGAGPGGTLAIGSDGSLYGTANVAGNLTACQGGGCGTVYRLAPPSTAGGAWTETTVYAFGGGTTDGAYPWGLAPGSGGTLYGTAGSGGPAGRGIVFAVTPPTAGGAWTESMIHGFSFDDGAFPNTPLTIGATGTIYGTTSGGGKLCHQNHGCGTLFQVVPPSAPGGAWTEEVLYAFPGKGQGARPIAGLAIDGNGVMYGTTELDSSAQGSGTVFEVQP